jgi:hypothetical protein
MTSQEVVQSIRQGKLIVPREWFADSIGIGLLTALLGASVMLLTNKESDFSRRAIPLTLALGALVFYGISCLRRERDLTSLPTNLKASDNRRVVVDAFQSLGWYISRNTQQAVIAAIPRKWYGFAGQTATVLLQDNIIYLNVLHHSTAKGRSPFSYGYNAGKLNLLIATINQKLLV